MNRVAEWGWVWVHSLCLSCTFHRTSRRKRSRSLPSALRTEHTENEKSYTSARWSSSAFSLRGDLMWLTLANLNTLLTFLSHRLCLRIFSLSKVLEGHYNSTVGDRLKVKNTFRPWYRVSGTGSISYHSSIISLYHHFKESFINIYHIIICITSWCMLNPLEFLSMRFQSFLAFPCFPPGILSDSGLSEPGNMWPTMQHQHT